MTEVTLSDSCCHGARGTRHEDERRRQAWDAGLTLGSGARAREHEVGFFRRLGCQACSFVEERVTHGFLVKGLHIRSSEGNQPGILSILRSSDLHPVTLRQQPDSLADSPPPSPSTALGCAKVPSALEWLRLCRLPVAAAALVVAGMRDAGRRSCVWEEVRSPPQTHYSHQHFQHFCLTSCSASVASSRFRTARSAAAADHEPASPSLPPDP